MGRINVQGGGKINPPLSTTVDKVLEGSQFSINGKEILVGTMVNRGELGVTASDSEQIFLAGYYPSITIAARPTLSGDAVVGDVLSTKTFYSSTYTKQTGTMVNKGELNLTPSDSVQTGAAGYYSGITVATRPVLSGDATTGHVLAGYTFYNSTYTKQTGGMTNRTGDTGTGLASAAGNGDIFLTPLAGFYSGTSRSFAYDPDFVPGNFLATKNIFGMQGAIPNRSLENGHMPATSIAVGPYTIATTWVYLQPPSGYYDGLTWVCSSAPHLVAGNLLSTVNILGVQGTIPVRHNTDTNGSYPAAVGSSFYPGMAYLMPQMGFYDGNTWVQNSQPNLTPANIRAGIVIGSITGTMPSGKGYATGTIAGTMIGRNNVPDYRYISGLSFVPSLIKVTYATVNNGNDVMSLSSRNRFGTWYVIGGYENIHCDVAPTSGAFQLRAITGSNTTLWTFTDITWYAYE